ncbi:MAG: DUF1287 domain-containing protein [Alphaproteobacteria bacterium]|nr:MAG: DUF1287 domain-containing protein [Alphaproteobacteria bacterium]
MTIFVSFLLFFFELCAGCPTPQDIVNAGRKQIQVTTQYDPSYKRLPYPGGDVSKDRGVCSDVVVRALRSIGIDLQKEIKESILKNPKKYTNYWNSPMPDSNIDHRRVPNMLTYFRIKGWAMKNTEPTKPGDFIIWKLPRGQLHIGIVSDRFAPDGRHPLIIHNICCGVTEEDIWNDFPILAKIRVIS